MGLYAGQGGAEYDIVIKIQKQEDGRVLNETTAHIVSGDSQTVKVALSNSVAVYAGMTYIIHTPSSVQPYRVFGNTGQTTCTAKDVTFKFANCPEPASRTSLEQGQIPQLFFQKRSVITIRENIVERYDETMEAPQPLDVKTGNEGISLTVSFTLYFQFDY